MNRVFILSPAQCSGDRARWLLAKTARSEMAQKLRSPEGASIGEVFTFLSALYFRGKLTYARAFARPCSDGRGIFVITPSAGLLPADTRLSISQLRGFGRVPIALTHRGYSYALRRGAKNLKLEITSDCHVVLLGSFASRKYLDILLPIFGERLHVPTEFIGRGDMSRGGLMLRAVRENRELDYIPAATVALKAAAKPRRATVSPTAR